MSADRLRRGEFVVLAGLLALFASLFLRWFGIDRVDSRSPGVSISVFGDAPAGWSYLGHPWIELLVVALVAGLAAVVLTARSGPGRPTYGAVVATVVAVPVAALVLLLTLLRVLAFRPTPAASDLGSDAIVSARATSGSLVDLARAQADLSVAAGAWVGLVGLLLLTVGLWLAMADDRTSAPESAVVPPAPSAVPPFRPLPEPEPATEASPSGATEPTGPAAPGAAGPSDAAPAPDPGPGASATGSDEAAPASGPGATPSPAGPPAPTADPPTRTFRPPGAVGPDDTVPAPEDDR